jgi:ribonuclease BN (tRNA processing enzyme)
MAVNVCVLRSGSKGNCTVVWTEKGALLLDCGNFPVRPFCDVLKEVGLEPEDIKGIVISHGHMDHINQYTFKISLNFGIPLYMDRETHKLVSRRYNVDHPGDLIKYRKKASFLLNDNIIDSFKVFHNGEQVGKPFGFTLKGAGREQYKIGYLTDTSKVTQKMIDLLADCTVLMIESNHDLKMAREASWYDRNWLEHLNNEAAADAVVSIKKASRKKSTLKHVFAMHISGRHNKPNLILKTFKNKFKAHDIRDIEVILTYQKAISPVITI